MCLSFFYKNMLKITYPNDGRKLKHFITGLLKSKLVNEIQRINYAKSYKLIEWELNKEEIKILLIDFDEKNKKKIEAFIKKNHPNKDVEFKYIKENGLD